MIYDDYMRLADEQRAKYGERTTVLMQVGDFFELYAVDNEAETAGADLRRVCDVCNLTMTRKNKGIAENSRKNPLMAGFPLPLLQKHAHALVATGETVVVVKQTAPPPNVRREVTDVLSPAMLLQPTQPESPFLMTQFWTEADAPHLGVGIACVDVSTGRTLVFETASHRAAPSLAEDEAARWVQTFAPREVVLFGDAPAAARARLPAAVVGRGPLTVHAKWGAVPRDFERPVYQSAVLALAFPDAAATATGVIEALDLAVHGLARTALTYLVQFAHDHSEVLVRRLLAPTYLHPAHHLHLQSNAARQLNAVGGAGERSLATLLNRCATAFGARLFTDRLLHPVHEVAELERRYAAVARLETCCVAVHKALAQVADLERLARRLALEQLAPMEWPSVDRSLRAAARAWRASGDEGQAGQMEALLPAFGDLDLDACGKYGLADIAGSVFHAGRFASMDAAVEALEAPKRELTALAAAWTRAGDGEATLCRVESSEREGWHLVTTKRRWEALLAKSGRVAAGALLAPAACTVRAISASSGNVRISHPALAALSDQIVAAGAAAAAEATRLYRAFLAADGRALGEALRARLPALADLDVTATHARNAADYGYVRPQAVAVAAEAPAFLEARGLRHPIIERVQEGVAYVPNDVALGGADEQAAGGWLLFGMNAAGKSSLMKSIGLAVLMAQSGMYVPCAALRFSPYHHLFTRISSGDDIWRGLSTFVVEMTELRNILQRCSHKSLVLGDELCAGTEAVSAVAIVAAGVEWLLAERATFVFATHLHELVAHVPAARLRLKHMHVEVAADGTLVYERQLREGVGHTMYGLEVCRGLGLPAAFLRGADATRRKLLGVAARVVDGRRSRYSRKVLVDACGVCGAPATETHHLVYQQDAGGNQPSNLAPLCAACHREEHAGALRIEGYKATSKGSRLAFARV